MNKKNINKNPKILVITQIHPFNIMNVYEEICKEFLAHNEIFSPQIMALLGEYSLQDDQDAHIKKFSYRVLNAAFVKNIKAAIQKMNPLKPWIIVGNCAKDIKFDYVIGLDGGSDFGDENNFDRYITEDNKLLQSKNLQIDYYTNQDAEIIFSTIDHLKLFLTTLGLKKGAITDGSAV